MPTSRAPLDKACADRRCSGGGNNTDGPSSPSFYIIFKVRPSAPWPKLVPTAPPDYCAHVLLQAAGALFSSSTCCRQRTLTHGEGLQGQAAPTLHTPLGGMPEELLGHAARAAQGCYSCSRAAGRAVGTGRAGQLRGGAGRARGVCRGSPVGFRPSTHSRGPRRHVCASGSQVSRRPIQK